MSVDLASLIDRLEKIESRLIKEESALLQIRCDVRDSMTLAKTIWDIQASEAMDGYTAPPKRQSIVKRLSMSGQTLLNSISRKSGINTKSKTHPTQYPKIERTASIDPQTCQKPQSSYSHEEQVADNYRLFQQSTRWDRFLRSSFFRKAVHTDGNPAFQSQSAINVIDDRLTTTFVIHPESKFKRSWDLIEAITIILQFFILPVLIGFTEFRSGLPVFAGITTVIFFTSIFISLRTGVVINFVLQMDPELIFDSYLKSGRFLFDILTTFPYVYVIDSAFPVDTNALLNHGMRFICVLNGLRILKLNVKPEPWWYRWFLNKLRMKTKINAASVGIAKILIIMLVYWHWSACIHNLVIKVIEFYSNTITYSAYSISDRYTLFFYHAAAETLAAGFGATPPSTMAQRWLTILNFLISSYLVATLVGNISSFMIGLDSSGRIFQEKMDEVSQYISYKELDWNLRNRILEYYHYKYSGGKFFDERRIMTELNNPLRQAIQLNNCKSLIVKVPFFRDADNTFISQIVLCLEINHFLTGDMVIEAGSTGDEMYFISSGICEVWVNGEVKATLASGTFFGEISLLFGTMKRTATIKCLTPCVLYSLSKKQLDEVLLHHPQMTAAIRAIAEVRLKQTEEAKAQGIKAEESIISVDHDKKNRHSIMEESEKIEEENSDIRLALEEEEPTESSQLSLIE